MKNIKKKSMMTVVATLIILLVAAIVLFAILPIFAHKMDLDQAVNVCKLSVIGQASTKIVGKSPFSLECENRYINFFDNKVQAGFSPDKTETLPVYINGEKKKSFNQLNDFIVNQVIAEEMRVCFFQFNEGKTAVFDNSLDTGVSGTGNAIIGKGQDVCYICSTLTFKNGPGKTYNGFMNYINTTVISNDKLTYYQYFNQPSLSKVPWEIFMQSLYDTNKNVMMSFDSSKTYSVVFSKQDKRWQMILETVMGGTGTGLLAGGAIGVWGFGVAAIPAGLLGATVGFGVGAIKSIISNNDWKNNYYVFVVPSDNLNNMCDVLAG